MIDLSVVVLAAGGSSRIGVSKQMMKFHGRTLVTMACERALKLSENVTIITGGNHHTVESELSSLKVDKVYNPNWESGIASSVALACKHEFNSRRMMLMFCHQPLIPFDHYQTLLEQANNEPEKIIATEYNDHFGAPAIIPHRMYYELSTLKGDESPDVFISRHLSETRSVTCEDAAKMITERSDMALLQA